jgi:hypothetical protein
MQEPLSYHLLMVFALLGMASLHQYGYGSSSSPANGSLFVDFLTH